jgi:hypothetical protein
MARDSTVITSRPTFPTYLLPIFSIPFRRGSARSSETAAESTTGSIPSLSSSPDYSVTATPSGSPPATTYFPNPSTSREDKAASHPTVHRLAKSNPDILRCLTCSTDIAFTSQIVSKGFTGRHGRAYLVSGPRDLEFNAGPADLINIRVGKQENRQLVTGWHVVADFSCLICGTKLGWKYVDATENSQKYKVGKFILETERVVPYRSWEDILAPSIDVVEVYSAKSDATVDRSDEVVFDSDDEDECEDIFAGTWDPAVVAKRRSRRVIPTKKQESE